MPITIAIANQKGGTGKTTTTVNLGYGLAQRGHKVLIVDLDPQGHVALALGFPPSSGTYDLLLGRSKAVKLAQQAREDLPLWFIAGDKSTALAREILNRRAFREGILKKALERSPFDVILLDCAPSLDVLHTATLVAANWLLVPVKLDHLALAGVLGLIATLQEVQDEGYDCNLLGVLPTFLDRVTTETRLQLEALLERYGELVLPPIPVDTKLREAPGFGQTIWEHAPKAKAAVGIPKEEGSEDMIGGYAHLVEIVDTLLRG